MVRGTLFAMLLSFLFVVCVSATAMAQGSTGGTLGKTDQSLSGGQSKQPVPEVKKAKGSPATKLERDPLCAKAIGTWAWVLGSGDVIVRRNGTFIHTTHTTEGSVGTWTCTEGRIVLKHSKGEERMTVSADGNTMSGVSWFTGYTIGFSVQRKQ